MNEAEIRLAIFDVDGTLIQGTSAERMFVRFLFRNGCLKKRNLFFFLLMIPWYFLKGGIDQVKGRNKMYLRGMSRQEFQKLVRSFSRSELKRLFSDGVLLRLKELKSKNYFVILLSGSLQELVDEIASAAGADLAVGVHLEYADDRVTGRICGIYPFGRDKVLALRKVIDFESVNWKDSWAFADRLADLPVFRLVGHPVAVSPERRLRKLALREGWEILE
jgi:HAD superfamily hydrolase (TIGR01490 family)